MDRKAEIMKRTEWFTQARFGMFIHWGLYAIPARGEWVRNAEKITSEAYHKYFEEFDPSEFDVHKWACLCKNAGMKYAVLTAKHHDGFCLFDSKYTEFKSTNTKYGKDIVREFLEAFRKEGIKVGLYYSLLDWLHPDYYHYSDTIHPMRGNEAHKDDQRDFDSYLSYMHSQIEELCTNYGKLDILWFDFSYGKMSGETWKATELMEIVRKHQPDVVVDNRLEVSGEGLGSIASSHPNTYSGDFVSPEQIIPPTPILDQEGNHLPWEACITLNNNWGYSVFDKEYKEASLLIRKLVECVSKGGNLLLNVGPDAKGRIPLRSEDILNGIGEWLAENGESIYNAGIADGFDKPDFGRYTQNGRKLYAHVFESPIGPLPIKGITKDDIHSIRLLSDKAELPIAESFATVNYPEYTFIGFGSNPLHTYALPDDRDTVVEITLKQEG